MMLNFCLANYGEGKTTTPYNSPHKYRFALKKGIPGDIYLEIWSRGKNKVLRDLVEQIRIHFKNDLAFGFVTPPSRTKIFVNDISKAIVDSFEKAIDFSDCFSKNNNFDAGVTSNRMSDGELNSIFTLDYNCFEKKYYNGLSKFLIIDDVFATGNTIRGVYLALTSNYEFEQIIKGAVLNTHE